MSHVRFLLYPLWIVCVVPTASAQSTADSAAIVAASRAFSDYYVRGDIPALARLYAENGVLLPPGREVRGRADIERYFTSGPNTRRVAHRMEPQSIRISGTLAVDVGTWSSTVQRGDAPAATTTDRYMVVWIRESDGAWRILYDMWHVPPRPQ